MTNFIENVCACMGPRLGQPYCPCEMQRRGLSDGSEYKWTEEEKARLLESLKEMAELEKNIDKGV